MQHRESLKVSRVILSPSNRLFGYSSALGFGWMDGSEGEQVLIPWDNTNRKPLSATRVPLLSLTIPIECKGSASFGTLYVGKEAKKCPWAQLKYKFNGPVTIRLIDNKNRNKSKWQYLSGCLEIPILSAFCTLSRVR